MICLCHINIHTLYYYICMPCSCFKEVRVERRSNRMAPRNVAGESWRLSREEKKKLGYHEGNGILNEGVQYYLGRNKGKNGQHEEKIPVCNVHALTTCSA